MIKLVLYGTLKNPDLFYSVTGFHFSHEIIGYIYGKLYEITDYTEPQKVFTYPLFIPSNDGTKVIAKEVSVDVDKYNKGAFWENLQSFEGDLYKLEVIEFYPFDEKPRKGIAYVGSSKKAKNIRIVKINTPFYSWQGGAL